MTAALQTSFAATGVFGITATYSGNGVDGPSTSTPLMETVITPTVSASIAPSSLTIQSGKSGQLVITLTPDGGYTGTVNFSCGTLPPHVSCAFAPPSLTIAAGSGPVMDTLTVSTGAPLMARLRKPFGGVTSSGLFRRDSFLVSRLAGGTAGAVSPKAQTCDPTCAQSLDCCIVVLRCGVYIYGLLNPNE